MHIILVVLEAGHLEAFEDSNCGRESALACFNEHARVAVEVERSQWSQGHVISAPSRTPCEGDVVSMHRLYVQE